MTTQQQRSEETRTALLEAAHTLFISQGYDATSVAALCEAAGVSKGAFYHHYGSKQDVFVALMQKWLSGIDTQIDAVREGADSIPAALRAMSGLISGVVETADEQIPLYLEFWSKAARDPEVWQATIEPYQRYQMVFAAMIEAGITEGSLKPVDAEAAARVIVAVGIGLLLQALLGPTETDWNQTTQEGIHILLEGLVNDI